ncbi:MAG: GTP-binding protein [Myxococcota bacterium]|jgi:GTP-binding protein
MKVEYIGGAYNPGEYPPMELPEVCFMGRSNVGKSSLINCLVRQRQMARVSRTPGRTQALHFFSVADRFTLVDFPGYGYAKAPKKIRAQFLPLINSYLDTREVLAGGLLLMDSRRDPRKDETDLIEAFAARKMPLVLVVTKIDKLAKTRRAGRVQQLAKQLKIPQQRAVGFSALKGDGRDKVVQQIDRLIGG